MEPLFWTFLFLSIYPYLIYPVAVYLMSHLFYRPCRKGPYLPRVSLVISVYNEERIIEQKLQNALALDYPQDLLEICVISDGSTDRTIDVVKMFADSRLVLMAFPERTGKTACLNRVVPKLKGDIVLFTDANSMFPSDILPKMMAVFFDDHVGLVTGWTKYVRAGDAEDVTGIYSKLERQTKYYESLISSCIGADGAVFAIRKPLYKALDNHDINDFVIPLHVISQEKRVVLDPEVYCLEEPAQADTDEYRRQVRITNRTLRAILANPRFLNPLWFGSISFFLLSHKLLRLLVPFFAAGTFFTNLFVLKTSLLYIVLLSMQLLFVALGVAGMMVKRGSRGIDICKFFLVTLSAQLTGWMRWLRGVPDIVWTPQR